MIAPLVLWRISNYLSLDGRGGLFASGRWHTKGRPVIYCSEDPSTALLETLVHLEVDSEDRPDSFELLKIECDPAVSVEIADLSGTGKSWVDHPAVSQKIGDAWLDSGRTLLLQVPNALVPERRNFIVNPIHEEKRLLQIVADFSHPYDARFFR